MPAPAKIDFKKTEKHLYAPKAGSFSHISVPPMQYLMVDGTGGPEAKAYADALSLLYPVAYKIKFHSKQALDKDYVVPPLSALWWADDMQSFKRGEKDKWHWRAMIRQPDWITRKIAQQMMDAVAAADSDKDMSLLRLETYEEGLAVQTLHVGPYSEEASVLAELHDRYLPAQGLCEAGHHHEIYLSDPRKTEAHKLKTILRQPVRPCN